MTAFSAIKFNASASQMRGSPAATACCRHCCAHSSRPKPGTDDDHALAVAERRQRCRIVETRDHELRMSDECCGNVLRARCQ